MEEVGWWRVTAPGTGAFPVPVALKKANELGLLDMSGNSFEVCNDTNASERRMARGGACFNRAAANFLPESVFRVDNRSASTLTRDRDLWDLGGIWGQTFRLVRNASPGQDSDGDGVTDYREDKDGTDLNDPDSFNPLSKGLVAYYPFDGSAKDESGYTNDGAVNGAQPSSDRIGRANSAYYFNGSSFITGGNVIPNYKDGATISCWVKSSHVGLQQGAVGKPRPFGDYCGFAIGIEEISGAARAGLNTGSGPGAPGVVANEVVNSQASIADDRWRHLLATTDGSKLIFYMDGQLIGEKQIVSDPISSDRLLQIGREGEGGPQYGPKWFFGWVDEVRVYNRALSKSDVQQLFVVESGGFDSDGDRVTNYRESRDGTDPFDPASLNPLSQDLLAYYTFDDNFDDESGYGRNLAQFSNVQTVGDVRSSKGRSLRLPSSSGSDARSTLSSGLTGNMPRSLSFWFYSDGPQPWPSGNIVMVGGDATSRVAIDRGLETIQIDNGVGRAAGTTAITNLHQRVHHFVWTYQDNLTNSKFYLNGVPVAAGALDNATLDGLGEYPVRIGDLDNRGFVGKIDDLRVYKRVLTPNEVQKIYTLEAQQLDSDQDGLTDVVEFRLGDLGFDRFVSQPSATVQSIFSDPNLADLYTGQQYAGAFDSGREQGRDDVTTQPGLYGLFNEDSLADVNLGGVVVRKLGNAVNLEVQVQMTPDIKTQPFTDLPYRHLLYLDGLPSNKAFMRIRALGPQ